MQVGEVTHPKRNDMNVMEFVAKANENIKALEKPIYRVSQWTLESALNIKLPQGFYFHTKRNNIEISYTDAGWNNRVCLQLKARMKKVGGVYGSMVVERIELNEDYYSPERFAELPAKDMDVLFEEMKTCAIKNKELRATSQEAKVLAFHNALAEAGITKEQFDHIVYVERCISR